MTSVRKSPSGARELVGPVDVTEPPYNASPSSSATRNTAAFLRAIGDVGAAGGGVVRVPAGRYALLADSIISTWDNVTLEGEGDATILDFSAVTVQSIGLQSKGSQAAGVLLVTDAVEGSSDLDVSGAGFAADDWVKVYSTAVTGSTNVPKGEIGTVLDAAAMTLQDPLCDTYTTATAASVAKLTFVKAPTYRNFRIVGPANPLINFSGILCDYTHGARFENITTERCHFYGIGVQDSVMASAEACVFTESDLNGLAYGLAFYNCAQDCSATLLHGSQVRHVVTHGGFSSRNGVPRRTVTTASTASACFQAGFDAHAGAEDVQFIGNTILGSPNEGITIECASAVVQGNTIRDSVARPISIRTNSVKPLNVVVSGNRVCGKNGLTSRGIYIEINAGYELVDALAITGNSLTDCRFGVQVDNVQVGRVTNMTVVGNVFTRCGANSESVIFIKHAQGVSVSGNQIYEAIDGIDGVTFDDVLGGTIQGNVIRLPNIATCRAIRMLTTTANIVIDGNFCSGGTNSVGVDLASTVTNCTVGPGNDVSGCTTGYIFSTGTGHRLVQKPGCGANVGNAAKTIAFTDDPTQLWNTALTADRAVTLPAGTVKAKWRIVRGAGATGAFNLNVGTGPLKALAAAGTWCDVESDGTNYLLTASGTL